MNEDIYENPMKEYQDYLARLTRTSDMSVWDAHQLMISRLTAEMYGLSPEEIAWLDENL